MEEPSRNMSRVTLKSSTIFISVGDKTEVYHSVAEVPPPLRKKLEQSTNGINSATILIADSKGKEEIVRAIRGMPSNLRSHFGTTAQQEARPRENPRFDGLRFGQDWAEFLLPAALGVRGVVSLYSQIVCYSGCAIAAAASRRTLAAVLVSGAITRMVSSPAKVPTISGHSSLVQRNRQRVRISRRRAQHDQILRHANILQKFGRDRGKFRTGRRRRYLPIAFRRLHQTQFADVARQRHLGGRDAAGSPSVRAPDPLASGCFWRGSA